MSGEVPDSERCVELRVSFTISAPIAAIKALVEPKGATYLDWRLTAAAWMREDLERDLPAADWEPFTRSEFDITLHEGGRA